MKGLGSSIRAHGAWIVALSVPWGLYGYAKLAEPTLKPEVAAEAAARFRFQRFGLAEGSAPAIRTRRTVNPDLERIAPWISAVGASIALADLDRDGLADDLCRVETRSDQVVVAPVPSTGDRYPPFSLEASPLPYDARTMAPMGCLPADLNEDGLTDLLVYYWGRTPIGFLRKADGDGARLLSSDLYRPFELLDGGEVWYTNAVTRADLDGDGHLDLVIGNYFQDGAAVLGSASEPRARMQHSMSRAYNGGKNRLLLWTQGRSGQAPEVHYRDASDALSARVQTAWTLAVGAGDLDGDLRPEIYFANDFGPDRLLHNRSRPGRLEFQLLEGVKGFLTPNSKVLGRDSFKGMGVEFADLNGDGLLDIYVSNIAAEYALEESHFAFLSTGHPEQMRVGVAPYIDRSEPLGLSRSSWSWDSRLADFDNDGELEMVQATGFIKGTVDRWPELQELAMGNDELLSNPQNWPLLRANDGVSGAAHNPFFVRVGGRFHDLASEIGLGEAQVSRGIATADVDGDGDLDFAVANQWEPSYFYRNDGPTPGAYLHLDLLLPLEPGVAQSVVSAGTPASSLRGRPAVGATARVLLSDGRSLFAQVDGGNGHSGARSTGLHFGLGETPSDARLSVAIRWRDPRGRERAAALRLSPGHHTVVLQWTP